MYDVEKLESISGKASFPIWFVVTLGYNVFNGILYSSCSVFSISFASSNEILKSTPLEEGYTT